MQLNKDGFDDQDKIFLSVVIATLGGPSLSETIESLNNGVVVPDEIIISIPEQEAEGVKNLEFENVRIHKVKCRGQVAQRCEGFKVAKGDYILQADDDIHFDKFCLSKLISALKLLGPASVCSPALYFKQSNNPVYSKAMGSSFISKMYYYLINGNKGYSEGIITRSGTEIGVNPASQNNTIVQTEWVPGGVVCHRKENLVLDNYYPHHGKAYSEDLYHSNELRKKGLKLYIVTEAIAWIDDPRLVEVPGFNQWLKGTSSDYKARKYLVTKLNKSLLRMNIYYFTTFVAYLVKRFKYKGSDS